MCVYNPSVMTWTSSDSNGNASLSELRKNAILDVRTIQELFGLEFPYPGTLLNAPKHDPWYALQLSIQHQFHELPLLYGNAVLRNLRDLCHFLGRTCDGFSESPILDQMSAVANFFFRLCGYQRRLAIVEPSSELGLIASVPHEVHTVGDFRHMPVVWVYYDDRAGDEPGNVIFAGMCNPNSVYSPSYNGGLTNRTAPPVCTHTEDLAQDDDLISSISVSGSDSEDDGSVSVISASADILEESGATNPPQPISHTPPPNAPTGPASLCWNCGGRGHRSNQCASRPICHNCAGTNHVARSCSIPSKECFGCKERGHLQQFCRVLAASRQHRNVAGQTDRRRDVDP